MKPVKASMFRYTVIRNYLRLDEEVLHDRSREFVLSIFKIEGFTGGQEHKLRSMESLALSGGGPQNQVCTKTDSVVAVERREGE